MDNFVILNPQRLVHKRYAQCLADRVVATTHWYISCPHSHATSKQAKEPIGTGSLLKKGDDIFALGKMAVTAKAQGYKIGTTLLEHCLNNAKQKQIKKLILYSNTYLESTIHLYRKYGFGEIELEVGFMKGQTLK